LPEIPGKDKTFHLLAYAVLAFLTCRAWPIPIRRGAALWRATLKTLMPMLAGIALIDELTQPLVGRGCELGDFLADVAGGLLAVLLTLALTRLRQPAHRSIMR